MTRPRAYVLMTCLTCLALVGCDKLPIDPRPDPDFELAAEVVVSGVNNPMHLTAPADDDRLFVVEQEGRIRVVRDDQLLDTPFLDIQSDVASGGERGLLSMAFHPEYAANGYFFVNYTDGNGDTRVVRYSVSEDPDVADPSSAVLILDQAQPFANHNGGHIVFGPDGMLYIAMGDGGAGGDPEENGQDAGTLLGALLRINVDDGDPYGIPSDNPFVGDPSGEDEIWAIGLRNPWRIAFDETSEALYIADAGQNAWEEVNAVPAFAPGLNYGWNIMEGDECFNAETCDDTDLILPVLTYPTGVEGCVVVGGDVYRGSAIPEIAGHYFYSDFCEGWLRSFRLKNDEAVDHEEWDVGDLGRILSFGVDAQGELYLLSQDDVVYRLVSQD